MNSELQVSAPVPPPLESILSPDALGFVAELCRRFGQRRTELLGVRGAFHRRLLAGETPGWLPETASVRSSNWRVLPAPADLQDRRVEITGPVDRKTIINGLNSGARVFMADFEDSHSPTWLGTLQGQANVRDAVLGTIDWTSPDGRHYELHPRGATLMVRPRGLHLLEAHLLVDGEAVPASLFDFGLHFFHNARRLVERGSGVYLYLPKIEHYGEAALWDQVFAFSEDRFGLARGSVRATVLVETLPAVFEIDEILFALREHSAGLNGGRWDYIFSFIKEHRGTRAAVLPDRASLTMRTPFLESWARLIVATAHRRGAHAIGGMSAYIPVKDDPEANRRAIEEVRADKEREVGLGYDGTWVAHPGLVSTALEAFRRGFPGPNQIEAAPPPAPRTRPDALLAPPPVRVTRDGVRRNVRVALRYLESWFRGIGCVPIDHLMEDAATVEIARSQLWEWVRERTPLEGDGTVTLELFQEFLQAEARELVREADSRSLGTAPVRRASDLLDALVTAPSFEEFFTLRAYPMLDVLPAGASR